MRHILFFSLTALCLAAYFVAKESKWLENEFRTQIRNIEIKNELSRQSLYIRDADSPNGKYAISNSGKISETFTAAIDSIRISDVRLGYLRKRKKNEADSLLFSKSGRLVYEKIAFMQQVKRLCDDSNALAALALLATNKGSLLSDSILEINHKIGQNLELDIKKSQVAFLSAYRKNNLTSIFGIITSMLIIMLALYFFLKLTGEVQRLNTELEHRVAKRTVQLEMANKELEAFSYSVSHDLRAPLRAINGYSSILQEDYGHLLDKEANGIIGILNESARHMGQLIDDLLKFSQLGRLDAIQADVDMNLLVQNTVKEMSVIKDLDKYNIVQHYLPPCNGDINMLKQVWFNLFDNAVKYSGKKENPAIEIGCHESHAELTYFIKDNGVGFDMAFADKLFGVFQRLHRKDEFEGTGLGLSLVKRIIEKHRGRVYGKSVLHNGSTFYFTIPKYSL